MGTRAYWFRHPWRYRRSDQIGWTYAALLRDVKGDIEQLEPGTVVDIEKRVGRPGDYEYEQHSTVTA